MKRMIWSLALSVLCMALVGVASARSFFKVGEPAPNFTLTSIHGETFTLQNLRGRVVVLGLFHICEPCLMQGSNLQKVYEATRGKNVAVVGVNSSGDSREDVTAFLATFPVRVTYPYLLDPRKQTDKLYGGGRFIPNVYIIDQHGVIRWQRVGNMDLAGPDVVLAEIDRLLASGST